MDNNFSESTVMHLPRVSLTYGEVQALRQIVHQTLVQARTHSAAVAQIKHYTFYENLLDQKIKELIG